MTESLPRRLQFCSSDTINDHDDVALLSAHSGILILSLTASFSAFMVENVVLVCGCLVALLSTSGTNSL